MEATSFLYRELQGRFFLRLVLVYMVISCFFSKVEGIWVISMPFKSAAPHLDSENYCCINNWILTNMVL